MAITILIIIVRYVGIMPKEESTIEIIGPFTYRLTIFDCDNKPHVYILDEYHIDCLLEYLEKRKRNESASISRL